MPAGALPIITAGKSPFVAVGMAASPIGGLTSSRPKLAKLPGEITAALHVTTPAITKGATVLEKSGLLERRDDDRDNRLVRLWLTEKGRALQKPVEEARLQVEAILTANLSKREKDMLVSSLVKIFAAGSEFLASSTETDALDKKIVHRS